MDLIFCDHVLTEEDGSQVEYAHFDTRDYPIPREGECVHLDGFKKVGKVFHVVYIYFKDPIVYVYLDMSFYNKEK